MPHERTRSSLLSDTLDQRRALTLSPGLRPDNCHTESPLKIPRRHSTGEEKYTETSKDRKKSNTKIHWSQLASNGMSPQSDPISRSTSDQESTTWQDIERRKIVVVLEDVLQTEIGQTLIRSRGQTVHLESQSEHKRSAREMQRDDQTSTSGQRDDQTSTSGLRDTRRTSVTLRSRTDSTEANDSSPSPNQTRQELNSCTKNESCSSRNQNKIKASQVKQMNSLKLSEPLEESSNSCSPRESDSPQYVDISEQVTEYFMPSIFVQKKVSSLEGSPQNDEAVLSGCEAGHSPLSSLEEQCSLKEDEPGSEHVSSEREDDETVEYIEDAEEDEKGKHKCSNGEVVQKLEGFRGSVLRLSVGADGEVPLKRCRLDSLSDEQVPGSDSASGSAEGPSCQPLPSETIVLSSGEEGEEEEAEEEEKEEEEEEEEEMKRNENVEEDSVLNSQLPEGVTDMQNLDESVSVYEQITIPVCDSHITGLFAQSSSMMELQLSSLHMGGVSAMSNENMKITTDKITISLKDSAMNISISMANVHKYSVWEGIELKGCELVKDEEIQPPSLLLLWLSDSQARKLHEDLSVIQQETSTAEGSTCVVLCLAEPVAGIESALLASLMDLVALSHARPELLHPLTHSDSLKLLQSSQETHLLQLLTPKSDTQTSTAAHATVSASVSAVKSQESDGQLKPVYTLCHRRSQGSYSVFMDPVSGSEWTPYRHLGPTRRLIQYPPPPSKGALTVTTEDLECLDSGEFLNDVIIDFYLKYLLVQKAPQASVERSHVFSSFFYKQLTRRDNANEDSTSTPAQVRRHQRVRTWTRHVDIFDKDFLFVPVNQESHWYLVVICFPGLIKPKYVNREGDGEEGQCESLEMETEIQPDNKSNSDEDKEANDSHKTASNSHDPPNCTESACKRQTVCKRPCILVMDSLKLSVHERIFKLLREYLQAEWEVKRGGYRDFSVEHMVGSHCKVPLQDNSSDCGLYLLQYAESFLQDPVVHFDLPLRLERWFPRQKVRGKREEIRDLILHLYRFQQDSLGNETLTDRIDYRNVIQ